MPLAADSVVKRAVLCTGVDAQNDPTGVASQFPAETKKVGLFLDFADAPANTEISLEWYRAGKIIFRQLLLASGDKQVITFLYSECRPCLRGGSYAVAVLQNDRLVARLPFTIQ